MTVPRVCCKQGVPFDETYCVEKHIPGAGAIMAALGDVANYYDGEADVMVGDVLG